MNQKNYSTPILFVVYNRPDTTKQVFEEIKKLKPKYLFVAADGYREEKENDKEQVLATRDIIINGVDWNCELKTRFSDFNQGCFNGVKNAINWFFENVEYGIILEDDIIPGPAFFKFQEQMLLKYKDDHRFLSVSGFNFGIQKDHSFTTRFMNMWGWGTWRRAATQVDYCLNKWKNANVFQKYSMLIFALKEGNKIDTPWAEFWYRKFNELAYLGTPGTWDFQWVFFGLMHNKRIIVPPKSLTMNIGFNHDNATHTKAENQYLQSLTLSSKLNIDASLKLDLNDKPIYEELLKKHWCFSFLSNYKNAKVFFIEKTFKFYTQKYINR